MSERVGVEQTPDIETLAAAIRRNRMVAYDDGKGGHLFRSATDHELAQALAPVVREARVSALREFVQWVATQRAYNGSDHSIHAQALYNESINAVLPEWAEEFLADRNGVDAPEGGEGR
jgi:hypothetical protein